MGESEEECGGPHSGDQGPPPPDTGPVLNPVSQWIASRAYWRVVKALWKLRYRGGEEERSPHPGVIALSPIGPGKRKTARGLFDPQLVGRRSVMRRRVYIIDDDQQVRQSTCFLLRSHDYQCRTFADGEAFLGELDRLEPGCVLLDIFMPGSSGLDVQADLARRAGELPVIAMSGHTDADLVRSALDRGAVEMLEKPFAEESLLAALENGFEKLEKAA